MSLIKCPECGKQISDTSKVCVHCGFKLKSNCDEIKKVFNTILLVIVLVVSLIPFGLLFADFIRVDSTGENISKVSGWNLIGGVDSLFEGSPYKSSIASVFGTTVISPIIPSVCTIFSLVLSIIAGVLCLLSKKNRNVSIFIGVLLLLSGILFFLTKFTVFYFEERTNSYCFLSSMEIDPLKISLGSGAIALGILDVFGFIISIVRSKLI